MILQPLSEIRCNTYVSLFRVFQTPQNINVLHVVYIENLEVQLPGWLAKMFLSTEISFR